MPTLSEIEETEIDAESGKDVKDAEDGEDLDAFNISLASFNIFGCLTSQLHICNWLVIVLN